MPERGYWHFRVFYYNLFTDRILQIVKKPPCFLQPGRFCITIALNDFYFVCRRNRHVLPAEGKEVLPHGIKAV